MLGRFGLFDQTRTLGRISFENIRRALSNTILILSSDARACDEKKTAYKHSLFHRLRFSLRILSRSNSIPNYDFVINSSSMILCNGTPYKPNLRSFEIKKPSLRASPSNPAR